MPAGDHFWLVVSSGGLPCLHCQCASSDGEGFLHFRSLLSNSPFVVFTATSAAVTSLRFSGGSRFTHPNSIGLGFFWWAVTLHVVLAPQFIVRCNSLVPELLSGPSQIQCPHGSYLVPFCLQLFLSKYCRPTEIVYADIRSSGRSWQWDMDPLALPSPWLLRVGEATLVLSIFARLAVKFCSGSCGLAWAHSWGWGW